jgi:hypothetical protein
VVLITRSVLYDLNCDRRVDRAGSRYRASVLATRKPMVLSRYSGEYGIRLLTRREVVVGRSSTFP